MRPKFLAALAVAAAVKVSGQPTVYRTVQVDGLFIFYRDAGPKDAPAILLLHGFPSSSRMYEPLLCKYDPSFQVAEAAAYKKDLPNAAIHILDAGHFALDTDADAIAQFIREFLARGR